MLVPQPTSTARRLGRVVLWGRPNVGKSALLNALAGDLLAVVSPRPQSTRYGKLGVWDLPQGQIDLVDTPGQLRPRHHLDKFMMRSGNRLLPGAQLVLFVVDGSVPPTFEDELAIEGLVDLSVPVVLALNKADLSPEMQSRFRDAYGRLGEFVTAVEFSAELAHGLTELGEVVSSLLPADAADPETSDLFGLTETPREREVSELIRAHLLEHLRQEIPHACAVVVEHFDPSTVLRIEAQIHVENERQKIIVIGRGGAMIRRIGTGARKLLEQVFGRRVFLQLEVQVTSNWRQRESLVRQLGFSLD